MLTSARNAVAAVAAVCAIAGCGSSAAVPAQPAPYSLLITEPSQNLTNDTRGSLIAYWPCARDADPRARFSSLTGGLSQEDYAVEHAKWTRFRARRASRRCGLT